MSDVRTMQPDLTQPRFLAVVLAGFTLATSCGDPAGSTAENDSPATGGATASFTGGATGAGLAPPSGGFPNAAGGAGGTTTVPVPPPGSGGSGVAGMPAVPGSGGQPIPGGGGSVEPGTGGTPGAVPALPPVTSVEEMGPFTVTIERGQSPGGGWVAYPTELGKDGLRHPIFVWGCGGGSQPSRYEHHLTFVASHGFVMEAHVSSGNASDHAQPIDWLLAENERPDSVYYQKLDATKIAAGGHSLGSLATFAYEGGTDLLTTSIHVAGGSFDGNGYQQLKTPTLHIGGVDDTLAGANTARDYERTTVPTFYANIEDTDHVYAARNGLPLIVAWLRWHLGGETDRRSMFVGDGCYFCGGQWNGVFKNW